MATSSAPTGDGIVPEDHPPQDGALASESDSAESAAGREQEEEEEAGQEEEEEDEEEASDEDDAAFDASLAHAGSAQSSQQHLHGLFEQNALLLDRHEWDRQWRVFMERRGSPVPAKMPTITGTVFDPYGMFLQVLRYGGWRQVVRDKRMHQVVKDVGVINRHGESAYFRTVVQRMKKKYVELVLPLETALDLQAGTDLDRLDSRQAQPDNEKGDAARGAERHISQLVAEKLDRNVWLEQWSSLVQSRGEDTQWPTIAGRGVDLYRLYYMVEEEGGIDEASRKRRWREMARQLGFLPGASATVKHHYVRQLLGFANYLSGVNDDVEDATVFDPLETPNNLLLADCKKLSETLAADGIDVEGSIKAAASFLESLAIGNLLPASTLGVEPPPGVPRDDNTREGRGPAGEDAELAALDVLLQERADRAAALDVAGVKLTDSVKKVLRAPLKPPVSVGSGGGGGANGSARRMVPLYRQGATLFCQGDFVTINSDESDVPFIAQLLSYDRVNQQLEVRWLYRCEEVESSGAAAIQRYRRKHFPSDDVAFKDSQWNGEHEIFFSFHTDTGVHINSMIGQVSVFFLEGYPLDAPVRLGRGEYFCRSVWDPMEKSVYYFGEKDFKREMRRVIDDEIQFSPYPYPQLPSMQEQVHAANVHAANVQANNGAGIIMSGPAAAGATAGALAKQMPQHHPHAQQTRVCEHQQQHSQAPASAMTGWGASRPPAPSVANNAKNVGKRRALIKMGSTFDDVPSLGQANEDWFSPEVGALRWTKKVKSSSSGDALSMDGDFEKWHSHMRTVWQRQAAAREEKRHAALRTLRQRQQDSALEEKANRLDEALTSRVIGKLKAAVNAAWLVGGPFGALNDQGRDAAAAVGHRLAGSLPLTWTVSMMRDDAIGTLRVLYRPPPAPRQQPVPAAQAIAPATALKDGEGSAQPAAVTLSSVSQVQQYLRDEYSRQPYAAAKRVLARPFLNIESMLHHEIATRKKAALKAGESRDKAAAPVSAKSLRKLDEAVIDETTSCLKMLDKRKMEFERQLKEAQEWRASLLQRNAQLKQAVRCGKPINWVAPVRDAQTSESTALPRSRTVVDQRSGRVWTEYPMDKKEMPARNALGAFRRAARALDRKHAHAHSGEASGQRWTRLKPSTQDKKCGKRAGKDLAAGEKARWKPRLGRTWWEASLREHALAKPVVHPNPAGQNMQDIDTETDSGSEDEDVRVGNNGPEKLQDLPSAALPKTPREYVGQRVQRCSLDAQGRPVAGATAVVVAYLPVAQAGFVSSKTGLPSGLWRVKFHDDALGEEELEHHELVDAYLAYRGVSSPATQQVDADGLMLKMHAPWRQSGNPLIGRFVRRGMVDRHSLHTAAGRLAGFVDGTIRAWLPQDASNYFPNGASTPQALFRVVYHCKEIGVEDLNLEEAQEAVAAYVPCNASVRSDEWLSYGNAYVGRRIRRSVLDPGGRMSAVDGMVRGWLPAELSNFVSEQTGRPAALWRVVYDHVGIGQEDLEDFEVEEAVQVYQNEVLLAAAAAAAAHPLGAGAAAQASAGVGAKANATVGEAAIPTGMGADAYDEWWTSGNGFVGRRVRRFILNEHGQMVNTADAIIRGWLPSDVSNFVDERTGEMAPLWRIRYDDAGIGEEDLELSEVEEAIELYDKDMKTLAQQHHLAPTSDPSTQQEQKQQEQARQHQKPQEPSQSQPQHIIQALPKLKPPPEQPVRQVASIPETDEVHKLQGGDDWLRQGHVFIGRRVRRKILDGGQGGQGVTQGGASDGAHVDGTVVGWLPAHMSNYFKDDDLTQPAALWRVQYDDPSIGQEDLEESEVTDAAAMYSALARPSSKESLPVATETKAHSAGKPAQEKSCRKNEQHGWRTEGNAFIGKRIRRSYLDSQEQAPRFVHGTVKSWVSADQSDYISENTGQTAALWLVEYDDQIVGEEELEASEVQEGMLAYQKQFPGEEGIKCVSNGMRGRASKVPAEGARATSQDPAKGGASIGALAMPTLSPSSCAATQDGAGAEAGVAASRCAQDTSTGAATEQPDEWMTTGSEYLNKRVRRAVSVVATKADGEGSVMLDGTITGWLPAEKSNFFKDPETELEPAALWRCSFDDVRAGEADLEEEEVVQGMREYETNQKRGGGLRERGGAQQRGGALVVQGVSCAPSEVWMDTGSQHLTKKVRGHGVVGQVIAWLPPDRSQSSAEGTDADTRQLPPVWRVQYHVEPVVEEQLTEETLLGRLRAYAVWKDAELLKLREDQWVLSGSEFLEKRVRKAVPNTQGDRVWLNATVLGWLPAEKSNYFIDDSCAIPTALWRAVYDDERAGGEDLELHELLEGIGEFERWRHTLTSSLPGRATSHASPKKRPRKRARQDGQKQESKVAERKLAEIRSKKTLEGKVLYLVHWDATNSDEDTWEEAAALGPDEWQVSEWEAEQLSGGAQHKAAGVPVLDHDEWHDQGHEWIGVRVQVMVPKDVGGEAPMLATVVGWLPADESNFFDDNGDAAALWRARFDVADVGYGDLEAHQVADGIKAFKESHDDNGGQGGSSVRAGSASAARTGVGGVTARAPTRGSLTLGKRERGEGKGHGKISDAREASPEAVEHSKARRSDNGEPEELARRSKRLPASSSGSPLSRGGRGTRKVAGGGVSDGESNAASPSPHIASPSRKHARPQDASGVGEGADATADGGRGKRVRMPKKRFEQSGSSPK